MIENRDICLYVYILHFCKVSEVMPRCNLIAVLYLQVPSFIVTRKMQLGSHNVILAFIA